MAECLTVVARIQTAYTEKFGIPRQSGLVSSSVGEIHFEGVFRNPDAVRGIEEFSHLWLLWGFSENQRDHVSLTVAPPRLGGRERRGVFATRSPFRPNGIGLSSVRLLEVRYEESGAPVLVVGGADLLDGTPIYDIKPYLPYTDAHSEADGGFYEQLHEKRIPVDFPQSLRRKLTDDLAQTVTDILAQDPRAAYNKKPDYVYGMSYAGYDIRFTVSEGVLTVTDVINRNEDSWEKVKG